MFALWGAHPTFVEIGLYSGPKWRCRAALQDASRSRCAPVPPTGFGVQHRSAVQANNLFRLRDSAAFKHRKARQMWDAPRCGRFRHSPSAVKPLAFEALLVCFPGLMKLDFFPCNLKLRHTWTISGGAGLDAVPTVLARLGTHPRWEWAKRRSPSVIPRRRTRSRIFCGASIPGSSRSTTFPEAWITWRRSRPEITRPNARSTWRCATARRAGRARLFAISWAWVLGRTSMSPPSASALTRRTACVRRQRKRRHIPFSN